jgi:hypothetical protein
MEQSKYGRTLIEVYREMLSEASQQAGWAGADGHDKSKAHADAHDRDIALAVSRELYYFCAQLEKTAEINP